MLFGLRSSVGGYFHPGVFAWLLSAIDSVQKYETIVVVFGGIAYLYFLIYSHILSQLGALLKISDAGVVELS